MSITERILTGIKQTLETGDKVNIDLREASAITGSGNNVGGRTLFDDAFAALRFANPIRQAARTVVRSGQSAVQFVAKTGNATTQANPWGYTFTPDSGTPGTNTSIWQLPTRVITAQLPIRSAVLSDVNYLDETLVSDLAQEFGAAEAASMILNNDQSGSTTTTYGATNGLRGLNMYTSAAASAFGSSGTAITDGIHSIATFTQAAAAVSYSDITDMARLFPAQYWTLPGTAWMMHPQTIHELRNLGGAAAIKQFAEVGDGDGGAVVYIFGFPVIPNPYMETTGAGKFNIYLANWPNFVTIADVEEMTIQAFDQTAPGFITLYGEKRLASTVRNPFAGIRLVGV
ncbi:major_cap_HK97, phage major capsid protein, HK97 family [uncultured Caudovirales phage]|uniref:Major_cap_HK97, phage major capsid protein, HK97 family n=1 Tax=uncultured Caudovirales phage TaxID=2100421 RepID=A0A6J5LGE4_9CAUD|nr:major_cap_HK97, phage major capsid protein, HK97 family [uncultured Caudovirales phage]